MLQYNKIEEELFLQIASTTIDFSFDFFCQGIFFFPYIAGSCQGWMRTVFGLNSYEVFVSFGNPKDIKKQVVMITLIPGLHYLVTYHLIFYRWQIILKDDHWMKIKVRQLFSFVASSIYPQFFVWAILKILLEILMHHNMDSMDTND